MNSTAQGKEKVIKVNKIVMDNGLVIPTETLPSHEGVLFETIQDVNGNQYWVNVNKIVYIDLDVDYTVYEDGLPF